MVKLIMGEKGTGKTKQIIDLVNTAAENEAGSVVCVAKGNKLTFDISHSARLVDTSPYKMESYDELIAFLSGIHAANFDVSQIYIDSLYKIVGITSSDGVDKFLEKAEKFAVKNNIKLTIAISADENTATEIMKKYIF